MILLTTALCGFALAPVAMSQPKGDAFDDPNTPTARPEKEIIIKVLADGKVIARGETIELAALEPILKEIAPEISRRPVRLVGVSSLPYQRMVDAIEACRRAGIWNIAMGQPKGDASADPNADRGPDEIVITLLRDGSVKMDHEVMTVPTFAARATELGKKFSQPHLRIISDGTAPTDLAAKVMEIIQKERLEDPTLVKVSPSDMLIRYEVFSIDPAKATAMRREKPADGKFYADLIAAVEKGEAVQESLMAVRCASGQKATTESVDREIYPTEYSSQPAGAQPGGQGENAPKTVMPVVPESFENRNMGEELEVEPTRMEGSPIIELRLIASLSWLAGRTQWGQGTSLTEMPIFEVQRVTTNANVTEGEPFLLSTMNPRPGSKIHPDRIWFAFATVTFAK